MVRPVTRTAGKPRSPRRLRRYFWRVSSATRCLSKRSVCRANVSQLRDRSNSRSRCFPVRAVRAEWAHCVEISRHSTEVIIGANAPVPKPANPIFKPPTRDQNRPASNRPVEQLTFVLCLFYYPHGHPNVGRSVEFELGNSRALSLRRPRGTQAQARMRLSKAARLGDPRLYPWPCVSDRAHCRALTVPPVRVPRNLGDIHAAKQPAVQYGIHPQVQRFEAREWT